MALHREKEILPTYLVRRSEGDVTLGELGEHRVALLVTLKLHDKKKFAAKASCLELVVVVNENYMRSSAMY